MIKTEIHKRGGMDEEAYQKVRYLRGTTFNPYHAEYFYIIPTQCFYRFFGEFDWSVGKIKCFLHFNKNPCL